jgi:hypothetical protein
MFSVPCFCKRGVSYPSSLFSLRYSVKYRIVPNTFFSFFCFLWLSPFWFLLLLSHPVSSRLASFFFGVTQGLPLFFSSSEDSPDSLSAFL